MSDIVERLRVLASGRTMTYDTGHIADGYDPMQTMGEAADEIDRLRKEVEQIKKTNRRQYDEGYAHGIANTALAKEAGQ